MGLLELLAKYDPFFLSHNEKHGNPGSGNKSHMSSTICEELITLIGQRVRLAIVHELRS